MALHQRFVLCPVDGEEGTVLVCTSGDEKTAAQANLTCTMLHSLGWRPHLILGVSEQEDAPQTWNLGCWASFAWQVALLPQILRCAQDLDTDECLMVVEDSCWPSTSLTPQRVYKELQERQKALWLAAALKPKTYQHQIGDVHVSAVAAAGSKYFCGDGAFWWKVATLFSKVSKQSSADSVFQSMVGMGALALVQPFLGATMPHVSQRTRQVGFHGLAPSDIDGNLLPLPEGWEKH